MRPFPFCRSRVRRAIACPLQSGCSARIRPGRPVRSAPFMPFVAHIGPQSIDLCLTDPGIFQPRFFHLCCLPGSSPQPVENRVFLDPFGARYAADTDPFRQQRQRLQNCLTRGLASIECCTVRFRKRLSAALAPITLRPILGFSEANDLRRFDVAVQLTPFVWAKLPGFSHLASSCLPRTSFHSWLYSTNNTCQGDCLFPEHILSQPCTRLLV
jgi:hypothetical protein